METTCETLLTPDNVERYAELYKQYMEADGLDKLVLHAELTKLCEQGISKSLDPEFIFDKVMVTDTKKKYGTPVIIPEGNIMTSDIGNQKKNSDESGKIHIVPKKSDLDKIKGDRRFSSELKGQICKIQTQHNYPYLEDFLITEINSITDLIMHNYTIEVNETVLRDWEDYVVQDVLVEETAKKYRVKEWLESIKYNEELSDKLNNESITSYVIIYIRFQSSETGSQLDLLDIVGSCEKSVLVRECFVRSQ